MRQLMVTPLVALAVLLLSTPDASAFGRRKHCADDCAPAPTTVVWIEKEVTAYKVEWKSRQVQVEVRVPTWVPKKETIEELVATWVPKKETIEELVPTWVKDKVTRTVWEDNYVKETHHRIVCRPVTQVVNRPVVRCRLVPVTCVDPCTGCTYTTCRAQTYVENVPCTVVSYKYERQPYEVTVNRPKAVPKQFEIQVCKYVPKKREVTYQVCTWVKKKRDVEYQVCTWVKKKRDVEYQVCTYVPKKVTKTEYYCERTPYKTKVKVPVCVPAPVCH